MAQEVKTLFSKFEGHEFKPPQGTCLLTALSQHFVTPPDVNVMSAGYPGPCLPHLCSQPAIQMEVMYSALADWDGSGPKPIESRAGLPKISMWPEQCW